MAFYTVEKRLKSDGTARYRCTVGIKQGGVYIHRESNTFAKQTIAKAWGAQRVAELEADGTPKPSDGFTLHDLLQLYLAAPDIRKGRDKLGRLRCIQGTDLAGLHLTAITMAHYVEYGRTRRAEGAAGSTVLAEMAYLKTVLDAAKPFFDIAVNLTEFDSARHYMAKMQITNPSNKRTRRPTAAEIDALAEKLTLCRRASPTGIPYDDIFEFAIYSCMRVGEICAIRWDDINNDTRSILVRDRKDPRKKVGNHMVVPLFANAWDIIQAQPRREERIFPYNSVNVSRLFIKAKAAIGVTGLRFHDLRREGASRLFELGFSVEEVAQVTGHKNHNTLWTVYREINPQTLHDRYDQLTRKGK